MRRVRSTDTWPELVVRRIAFSLGFRYRLHKAELPGKPDLAFPRLRKVILVNGCFWHGHHCARGARIPRENRRYWVKKISRNVARDRANQRRLRALGWSALVIWECQLKRLPQVAGKIHMFLKG